MVLVSKTVVTVDSILNESGELIKQVTTTESFTAKDLFDSYVQSQSGYGCNRAGNLEN